MSSVTRHVTVSDVGKALHPGQVRGQDEGAAVMALGHTLMEQILLDDEGRIRNLGAIDYRSRRAWTCRSRMESAIVENEDGPGPYGSKGMSEGALLNVAPAVAAAVRDATGVVIRDLPLHPERVWRALRDAEAAETRPPRPVPRPTRRDLRPRARRAARPVRGGRQIPPRRQGAEPRRDGPRPRPARASGLRHHDRDLPALSSPTAGRPASTTSCASGCAASRPRSDAGSATRPIPSSSACAPELPSRCPG